MSSVFFFLIINLVEGAFSWRSVSRQTLGLSNSLTLKRCWPGGPGPGEGGPDSGDADGRAETEEPPQMCQLDTCVRSWWERVFSDSTCPSIYLFFIFFKWKPAICFLPSQLRCVRFHSSRSRVHVSLCVPLRWEWGGWGAFEAPCQLLMFDLVESLRLSQGNYRHMQKAKADEELVC